MILHPIGLKLNNATIFCFVLKLKDYPSTYGVPSVSVCLVSYFSSICATQKVSYWGSENSSVSLGGDKREDVFERLS